MTTCIECSKWSLKDSPLRAHGFGRCSVDPNMLLRAGRTFPANNPCRFGLFVKADAKVVERRQKEGAVIL